MSTRTERRIEVGDRLPGKALAPVRGRPVDLHRTPHDSSILVFPHPGCDDCLGYLHHLETLAGALATWGGRALAVVAGEQAASTLAGELTLAVLVDDDGRVRAGAGIAPDDVAVLVADAFGTVYRAEWAGSDHRFPSDEDLIDEARYIGTQCPECGVPDEPLRGEESWGL